MLEVGEQQLLVLLLVVKPEGDDGFQHGERLGTRSLEERVNRRVDRAAVGSHVTHGRPGQEATPRALEGRPDPLIVGVKKVVVPLVDRSIGGHVGPQQERLEKPGGVREVPTSGAGVRHALKHEVLDFQRCAQLLR